MKQRIDILDVLGVGIGPANLSLAALSQPLRGLVARFYDQVATFAWHPGLLFPESFIQTSYLKDLVTPVDPTSRYSFLSFLVENKRFYSFLTASFPRVSRMEFGQYLAWVAGLLPSLSFDCPILEIDYRDDLWIVTTGQGVVRARDIVLGTGLRPYVPEFARTHVGRNLHHAIEVGRHNTPVAGRRVAVIGGGQSGAELVHHFLSDKIGLPQKLLWVSRREGFPPLDDSPFANELFTPEYSDHFFQLESRERDDRLRRHTLASDGVSISLLQDIYRQLYTLQHINGGNPVKLLASHTFTGVDRCGDGWQIELRGSDGRCHSEHVDVVLLATGYHYALPDCLQPIAGRIQRDGTQLRIGADFSVAWDGPAHRRIFVQNGARHVRGVADPNLSLLAWRSAVILNRLVGREVYDCRGSTSILHGEPQSSLPGAASADEDVKQRRSHAHA